MEQETMWRMLGDHPRLWVVKHGWYPPTVELNVEFMDDRVLSSTISNWQDGRWWIFTSYHHSSGDLIGGGGGERVLPLHPNLGMTLLQTMNRTGGPLDHEDREFVVIDHADNVETPALFGGRPFPLSIRRITLFRPPQGHSTFNYLLNLGK